MLLTMTMQNDKAIPKATEKAVHNEAGSACPFCGDTTLAALEIHHIDSRAAGGSNHRSNLILCCASCHRKIESGDITLSTVLRTKEAMVAGRRPRPRPNRSPIPANSNVLQFRGSNTGIVANQVHFAAPKRPRLQPPPDVLATDSDRRAYTKYLIDHYHRLKRAEVKGAMKYAVLHQAIKKTFGCTWEFVPLSRFEDLVEFLQTRIDGTRLGRIRRSRGERNYRPYEEYLREKRHPTAGP